MNRLILNHGDSVIVKHGEHFNFTCCECRLVHKVVTAHYRGGVKFTIWRDKRMTNMERRKAK